MSQGEERFKTILREWFEFKTGVSLSDDTLVQLIQDMKS